MARECVCVDVSIDNIACGSWAVVSYEKSVLLHNGHLSIAQVHVCMPVIVCHELCIN